MMVWLETVRVDGRLFVRSSARDFFSAASRTKNTRPMSVDQVPVKVHRCRFVDYLPAAITALAFPPLSLPSLKGKAKAISPLTFPHLAIGRANGNIELAEWSNNNPTDQAPQAWVVLKVYRSFFSMSSRD